MNLEDLNYQVEHNNRDELKAKIIEKGLLDYNFKYFEARGEDLDIFLKYNNNIIGGILAEKYKNEALYVDMFWIDENFRGQGLGNKLLEVLEKEVTKLGINKIYLDTYEFQARGFYEKYGYKVIGIIPKYIAGYDKIFLLKTL